MTKASELYAEQKEWRLASVGLLPRVAAVEESIRNTIRLRSQRRMPRDTALYVAACNADHRDISLNF